MKKIRANTRRFIMGKMMRHLPGMITCSEFETFIVDYLDGLLPDDQQQKFERHIRFCRECREYLEAYKQTIENEKSAFADEVSLTAMEVPEDLVAAVIAARDAS